MRRVKKNLTYAILSTKTTFKTLYTYKIASILNFITQIILLLAQFYFWNAIYDNSTRLNNYTFIDMITYLVISYSIGRLYPFNISNKFGNMVRNGDIIHSFLKPIAFEYQLLTDSFGELLYKLVFISTPIMMTGYLLFGIELSWAFRETLIFLIFLLVLIYLFLYWSYLLEFLASIHIVFGELINLKHQSLISCRGSCYL